LTDPSTPTSPEFSLSAALEDAEGRELADAIIARKKYRNIRDRFMQQLIWGDVLTDGHGNVIPRELPDYWASVKEAWDAHVEGKLTHTRSLNRPAVTELRGPMFHMTWTDELMTHETGWRNRLLVGGRGYGKNRARAESLRGREVITDFLAGIRGEDRPWASSIRWVCKPPTAPVYAVGTNGWLMEQAEARVTPAMREHNRRIGEQNAALYAKFADLLGVKPRGTHD
jgi:hypothetical protein